MSIVNWSPVPDLGLRTVYDCKECQSVIVVLVEDPPARVFVHEIEYRSPTVMGIPGARLVKCREPMHLAGPHIQSAVKLGGLDALQGIYPGQWRVFAPDQSGASLRVGDTLRLSLQVG